MIRHKVIDMKTVQILITHNFKSHDLEHLDEFAESVDVFQERARTPEEVTEALRHHPDTDVLYTIRAPHEWSSDWKLRWIALHYAGADHVPFEVIPPGVEVTSASGVNSIAIAEHAFALILALRRRVPEMLLLQNETSWPDLKTRWHTFAQPLLRENSLGILGYGSIGREIARLAKTFGMRVLAYKRNPADRKDAGFRLPGTGDPDGSLPDAYYGPEGLFDMLSASDIVVNVLPATPETYKVMDTETFSAIKPSSMFISIGRGRTVYERALIDAIERGHLSGAGLDVFEEEPLPPESPLWRFKNVIISPHIGGFFAQYDETAMILFQENITRFLSGTPLLNRVNRDLGY